MTWTTPITFANGTQVSSDQLNNMIGHTASGSDMELQDVNLVTTLGDLFYATGATALTRLGIGSNGQWLGSVAGVVPEWVNIQSVTQISSQIRATDGLIDISSVAMASFQNLLIYALLRGTSGSLTMETCGLTFNNDTGSNYDYIRHRVNNAGATPVFEGRGVASIELLDMVGGFAATTQLFSELLIFIPNHAVTNQNRSGIAKYSSKRGTSAGDMMFGKTGFSWRNTSAAITRFALSPAGGLNLKTGSAAYVYGLA